MQHEEKDERQMRKNEKTLEELDFFCVSFEKKRRAFVVLIAHIHLMQLCCYAHCDVRDREREIKRENELSQTKRKQKKNKNI